MPGVYTESPGKKDGLLVLIVTSKTRRMSLWFAYPSCPRRGKENRVPHSHNPYTAMGLSPALPTLLLAQPLMPASLPGDPMEP